MLSERERECVCVFRKEEERRKKETFYYYYCWFFLFLYISVYMFGSIARDIRRFFFFFFFFFLLCACVCMFTVECMGYVCRCLVFFPFDIIHVCSYM